ncbi:MAG: hypothetical protein KGZ83_17970 [Sulfuricella sp.]|nr:hypothetical protein [Sulfuricella sp.]
MTPQSGLSFDQAPPILVPFRFFLSAPLFGLLAAVLVLVSGAGLLESRWLPPVLAFTHLMTLGFLGLAMTGALFQMLPVVAGAPVAKPVAVSLTVYALLVPGILLLVGGFLAVFPLAIRLAMILLGSGFLVFILAAAVSLKHGADNPTAQGMRLALLGLAVTVSLGLALASNYGWGWWLADRVRLTTLHLSWGLLGWVGMLVVGVAYQVVPMFQLTPSYPKPMTRRLTIGLFVVLLLWTLLYLGGMTPLLPLDGTLFVAGFGLFAGVTLRLQTQRRRKVSDVTLLFWRYGMGALLAAPLLWLAGQFFPEFSEGAAYPFLLGTLFIGGFAVSVVNGMLYKIVPFLIWFHLQSRLMGVGKVPNMKEILPDAKMRRQMWLHFASVPLFFLAVWLPPLIYPAAVVFACSMLLLEANLLSAFGVYRRNIKLVS